MARHKRTEHERIREYKINEQRSTVAETDEELRCNEDVEHRSQRGKSLLDICRVEIVFIPPGKLKVIV